MKPWVEYIYMYIYMDVYCVDMSYIDVHVVDWEQVRRATGRQLMRMDV